MPPSLLGRRFVLDTSPLRVGRGAENQIVLEGDSVSRKHAHVEQRGSTWFARFGCPGLGLGCLAVRRSPLLDEGLR